ncbi:MAG: hypothetical protein DRI57_16560 [Deltaproteobacteria bacterium]|nr:MAG: hypothetical protein DRI57_16560 [Deltaproteobacteria bacterium]
MVIQLHPPHRLGINAEAMLRINSGINAERSATFRLLSLSASALMPRQCLESIPSLGINAERSAAFRMLRGQLPSGCFRFQPRH